MKTFIRCAVVALVLTPSAGAAQDSDPSLGVWRPLAEEGDADAQYILGLMYEKGRGVLQDDAEAVRWYRLAAEQGDAWAQHGLGLMYAKGQGVVQDYSSAHVWLNIAAANGYEGAGESRDIAAGLMTADAISEAQQRAKTCMESNYQDCE